MRSFTNCHINTKFTCIKDYNLSTHNFPITPDRSIRFALAPVLIMVISQRYCRALSHWASSTREKEDDEEQKSVNSFRFHSHLLFKSHIDNNSCGARCVRKRVIEACACAIAGSNNASTVAMTRYKKRRKNIPKSHNSTKLISNTDFALSFSLFCWNVCLLRLDSREVNRSLICVRTGGPIKPILNWRHIQIYWKTNKYFVVDWRWNRITTLPIWAIKYGPGMVKQFSVGHKFFTTIFLFRI